MSIQSIIAKTGSTALIQTPTTTFDTMNSPVETWATVGTYSALPVRLRLLRGDELVDSDKRTVNATHKAYFEGALTSVDETCRLTVSSEIYRITLVENWNKTGDYTMVWCERID